MTGRFDTIVMVDWSGGNDTGPRPRRDAIWAAVSRPGAPGAPAYLRNRQVALDWLGDLIGRERAAGRRVLAGFDFPFGYPAGFAERIVDMADPLALWDWFADRLVDSPTSNNRFDLAGEINRRFDGTGPFWFNALARDIPDLPRKGRDRHGHGMAERRLAETRARGAFTCWQLGGAGAVGSQAITGMAALARLRRDRPGEIAVWPFEPLDRPVALVEVWPSLIDDAVRNRTQDGEIRDAAQVRVLAEAVARLSGDGALLQLLDDVDPAARDEEGWILGIGHEAALTGALR